MELEEIRDKFNMALAQRLTIDAAKCQANFVLQGLAVFKTEDGRLSALPFTVKSEDEFPMMISAIETKARTEKYTELCSIGFAQTYMNYTFRSKEEQAQAETSPCSPDSDEGNPPVSSEPPSHPES